METTLRTERVNPERELLLAFDVSKARLNYRSDVPQSAGADGLRVVESVQGEVANRSRAVEGVLRAMTERAARAGYAGVHVLCEPSGGYEKQLLSLARHIGCRTSYVNGESVHKAKVIDHNDRGKSDQIDTGVMLTLAGMGKVQTHRVLPPLYQQLRLLGRFYSGADRKVKALKDELQFGIARLFVDFSGKAASVYSKWGRAVMEAYGYNPYRMVAGGYRRFYSQVRRHAPRLVEATARALWEDAVSASHHVQSQEEVELWEKHVRDCWRQYLYQEQRRAELREQMSAIYLRLLEQRELLPRPDKGYLSVFRLARIVGETGPLSDFSNPQAILKYAGLNLCENQSGIHKGQVTISHKGNSQLRNALGEAAFCLVRRRACYGAYYHRKKEQDNLSSGKAMTAVMRKMLVAVWTLGVKQLTFDLQRLTTSLSQYRQVA